MTAVRDRATGRYRPARDHDTWPRCQQCGAILHETLAGDLLCVIPRCARWGKG